MTLGAVLVAAALPGCGGSDDPKPAAAVGGEQRGILDTIDVLQTAARAGDGKKICATVFTTALVRSIEQASPQDCAAEVAENVFTRDAAIAVDRNIAVKSDTATAVIREQNGNVSTLHFVMRGGSWRIDRVTPKAASQ